MGRAPFVVPQEAARQDEEAMRAELAALKAVVYGPDPPAAAVERMAEVRAALERSPGPPPAGAPQPRTPPMRRARPPAGVAAVGLLAVLAVGSLFVQWRPAAPPPVPAPSATADPAQVGAPARALRDEDAAVRQVVLNHPDELSAEDWFTLDPAALPRPWSAARPVTDRPGLVGPRTVPVPLRAGATRLLVFVVCSDPGVRFGVALDGPGRPPAGSTGIQGARCRGFTGAAVGVPAGASSALLRIRIGTGEHYAVTVYER